MPSASIKLSLQLRNTFRLPSVCIKRGLQEPFAMRCGSNLEAPFLETIGIPTDVCKQKHPYCSLFRNGNGPYCPPKKGNDRGVFFANIPRDSEGISRKAIPIGVPRDL